MSISRKFVSSSITDRYPDHAGCAVPHAVPEHHGGGGQGGGERGGQQEAEEGGHGEGGLETGDTDTEITLYHHPGANNKIHGSRVAGSRDLSLFYIYPDRYKYLESININTCWRITRCEDDKNI